MWRVQESFFSLDRSSGILPGLRPHPGHIEDDRRSGDLDVCISSTEDIENMMNLNILYSLDRVWRRIPGKHCQDSHHTILQRQKLDHSCPCRLLENILGMVFLRDNNNALLPHCIFPLYRLFVDRVLRHMKYLHFARMYDWSRGLHHLF